MNLIPLQTYIHVTLRKNRHIPCLIKNTTPPRTPQKHLPEKFHHVRSPVRLPSPKISRAERTHGRGGRADIKNSRGSACKYFIGSSRSRNTNAGQVKRRNKSPITYHGRTARTRGSAATHCARGDADRSWIPAVRRAGVSEWFVPMAAAFLRRAISDDEEMGCQVYYTCFGLNFAKELRRPSFKLRTKI